MTASTFNRRRFLQFSALTAGCLAFGAEGIVPAFAKAAPQQITLSPEDQQDIDRIEQYLNDLTSVEARFQQYSADSGLVFGKIYLRRPGRLRVEYDPPSKVILVADGIALSYYDGELNNINQVPLNLSPMWFLLKDKVLLNGKDVTLTSFKRAPGAFQVGLVQTDQPDAGNVVLEFGDKPLELRQWTLTDNKNQQVQVGLYDAHFGVQLANELFATPQRKSKKP
ncbi:MAG TPA: outer-membrane lipoprotein carrier protein LolA [Terriglobales bacterium]|nr:outer-membrane lipoprotein carrier protein LolA [Terriglobales bacterium]